MTTITATTTVYLNDADASFLGFNRAAPARLRAAAMATDSEPCPAN